MNLRSKLLLGIGIALIVAFSLTAVLSYLAMEQSYRALENQEVQKAVGSARSSLENDMQHTYSISRDYAAWSETYRFAQDQNPGWIAQNMNDDFFIRFDIDYLLVFNRSNQLVFSKGYNLTLKQGEPVPDSLLNDSRKINADNAVFTSTEGTYGIVNSPSGLYILSAHPILKDNFVGPAAGSLLVLRRIDSQYLADLGARAGSKILLLSSGEVAATPSLAGRVSGITPDTPVAVIPDDPDTITGYTLIKGLRDQDSSYILVTEPRTIYKTGMNTIFIFLISLLGAGIFIILFVLLFIDRIVLSRLNTIIGTVRTRTEGGISTETDDPPPEDELSQLALEIDPVFLRLAESRIELKDSEERYRTLVDKLPDYVIVHRDGILLYVNPAAAARTGYSARELSGKSILPFIAPEYHDFILQAADQRISGQDVPPYEIKLVTKDGTLRTVLANGAVITYEGKPASLNVLTDITSLKQAEETIRSANAELEQRVAERTEALSRANEQLSAEIAARAWAEEQVHRSLQEKDLLLREIHHRVKNNLQIIASLLKLQSRYISDPNVLGSIVDSQSRVRAMALVHERIYRSHNIAEINLRDYLTYLTRQIFQFYNIQQYRTTISVDMEEIMADIDTVTPLGLIINELISNSLKHAFPEGRKGAISIACTLRDADTIRIVYHDDGTGLPAGFDWRNTESLGLRLVNSLVDQLNGTIEAGSGQGTTFIITVQKKRVSPAS